MGRSGGVSRPRVVTKRQAFFIEYHSIARYSMTFVVGK